MIPRELFALKLNPFRALTGLVSSRPQTPHPIVATSHGSIEGAQEASVYAFKGIPYAAPPVGALRWRPPQAAKPWRRTRDATRFGPPCTQLEQRRCKLMGSEDCLTLNVWTPSVDRDAMLPVFFFIHGGDHVVGSSAEASYHGQFLSVLAQSMVVTFNYRLGACGFLAHPAFHDENAHGAAGNYGLMDAIAALRWVRENARNFGGDASKVVLVGQSAGSINACALLTSQECSGLFAAAILHSGPCHVQAEAIVGQTANEAAEFLGCSRSKDPAACLRSRSIRRVVRLPGAGLSCNQSDRSAYRPNVDGFILRQAPERVILDRKHNQVPVIIGTNADEYSWILAEALKGDLPIRNEKQYLGILDSLFGPHQVSTRFVADLYPFQKDSDSFANVVHAYGDYFMQYPSRALSRLLATNQPQPIWRFVYAHTYSNGRYKPDRAGHGFELPFLFRHFDLFDFSPNHDEEDLSRFLIAAWRNFALTGNPNVSGSPVTWPQYRPCEESYLVLDTPLRIETQNADSPLDYWERKYPDLP
jgi:para-nitrobenzyl esterase